MVAFARAQMHTHEILKQVRDRYELLLIFADDVGDAARRVRAKASHLDHAHCDPDSISMTEEHDHRQRGKADRVDEHTNRCVPLPKLAVAAVIARERKLLREKASVVKLSARERAKNRERHRGENQLDERDGIADARRAAGTWLAVGAVCDAPQQR